MMTNEAAPHSDSRLRIAARKGDLAQVKWLMQELPTFSSLSDCLPSALSDAIRAGHVTTASCLLEHGAKLPSDVMSSALASNGSQDMFQLALDHGWDINGRTTIGNPVFTSAIHSQSVPLVRWFLDHGADPSLRGRRAGVQGAHMLDVAAASSSPAVLDLLIERGLKLEDSDALPSAISAVDGPEGRLEMVAHLLDLGCDINAVEKEAPPSSTGLSSGTPLHTAVLIDNPDYVSFLLDKGADREARNTAGQNVTEFAIEQDSVQALKVLKRQ